MWKKPKKKREKILAPTTEKIKELREKEWEGIDKSPKDSGKPLTEKILDSALKEAEKIK